MRAIDADYVLGEIGKYAMHPNEKLVNNLAIAFDIVVDAPTIEVPKWIPCSERLPNEETSVLVTFGYGEIGIDIHTDGWANNGWIWHDDVIAWMPLPKAYEESEK